MRAMRDFGRFVSDLNQGLDEVMGTIDRMQKLYRSFRDLIPVWQQLTGWLQRQEMATTSMSRPVRHVCSRCGRKCRPARRRTGKRKTRTDRMVFW